jgi:hypothetical protein
MSELESHLETWFRVSVRRAGGHTFKLAPTEAGVPDRLVVLPGGRLYLVELKREGGSVSPIQSVWHHKIRRLGGRVIVLAGRSEAARWLLDPDSTHPVRRALR